MNTRSTLALACLLTMTASTLFASDAHAQRRVSCDDMETKQFAANLFAKQRRLKQPYSTPIAKKAIWPYLMGAFDLSGRTTHKNQAGSMTVFNQAYLVKHTKSKLNVTFSTIGSKAKAAVQVCTYEFTGHNLSKPTWGDFKTRVSRSLSANERSAHVARTTISRPARMLTQFTLIYISPGSRGSYMLHLEAK